MRPAGSVRYGPTTPRSKQCSQYFCRARLNVLMMPKRGANYRIAIRRATEPDFPAIRALAVATLGWLADEQEDAFFRWKHLQNPFGASPMWVAVDDEESGRVAAFRTFLRWDLVMPDGR